MSQSNVLKVRPLTDKQRKFCDAYLGEAEGKAYEAARLAGYNGSRRTLEVIGSENMRKPEIRKRLDELSQKGGGIATREERQAFFTKIMRADHRRMSERLRAAELLCKTQGDFIERRTVDLNTDHTEKKRELDAFLSSIQKQAQTIIEKEDEEREEEKENEKKVQPINAALVTTGE